MQTWFGLILFICFMDKLKINPKILPLQKTGTSCQNQKIILYIIFLIMISNCGKK